MGKRILGTVLGLGLGFRLVSLGRRQLSTDELMQALIVRSDSVEAMLHRLRGGLVLATPLDPLLQKAVVFCFGESAWTLRLHAVLLSVLSLWIFFRISRRLFGERVALYSTALFTLYPLHYHYSQEGLPHAACTLLTLLSYDLLLGRVMQEGKAWRAWLAWSGTQILLLLSSSAGIAVLFSQFAALALSCWFRWTPPSGISDDDTKPGRSDLRRADRSSLLVAALFALPALAFFLPWARFAWQGHLEGFPEAIGGRLILRIFKEVGDGSYPVTGILIIGIVTGARALIRHRRQQALLWCSAWFVVPFPVIIFLDRWGGASFSIGQILPGTAPLFLMAGYGLSHVGERLRILEQPSSQVSSPALVYAVALTVMSAFIAQSHWRREPVDWRGTAQYLQEEVRPEDSVTIPVGRPLLEYYAPSLAGIRQSANVAGGAAPPVGQPGRQIVVCLAASRANPCSGIRAAAASDRAWSIREYPGLRIFVRK